MDDEANLKRQARRRLIGAVALVTAVVVILPMVLDSEPRVNGQNIELRIPDPDKAGAFKPKIALPPEPAVVSEPAASSEVTGTLPTVAAAPVAPPAAVPQAPKPRPQPALAPSKPAATSKPVVAKPKPAAKPAEKAKAHAAPKSGYVVQVGAFSNAATATHLQEKLSGQGLPAYTEKSGSTIRVRVGGYPTREAADKVLHKLEAQGMHPVLTTQH